MSNFIVQDVNELLRSNNPEDVTKGVKLFVEHNLTVAPTFSNMSGKYPVWRPYLKADSVCGTCHNKITAYDSPALWGGKLFHFSCWHIHCWTGLYDVNTADRSAYKVWTHSLDNPTLEEARWHRIVKE